ncbi:unknown [Prevotella sp. CAG:487]|nr:unknown [Prevotella sp. CAG:487]
MYIVIRLPVKERITSVMYMNGYFSNRQSFISDISQNTKYFLI